MSNILRGDMANYPFNQNLAMRLYFIPSPMMK